MIIENNKIASKEEVPICQYTGLAVSICKGPLLQMMR